MPWIFWHVNFHPYILVTIISYISEIDNNWFWSLTKFKHGSHGIFRNCLSPDFHKCFMLFHAIHSSVTLKLLIRTVFHDFLTLMERGSSVDGIEGALALKFNYDWSNDCWLNYWIDAECIYFKLESDLLCTIWFKLFIRIHAKIQSKSINWLS